MAIVALMACATTASADQKPKASAALALAAPAAPAIIVDADLRRVARVLRQLHHAEPIAQAPQPIVTAPEAYDAVVAAANPFEAPHLSAVVDAGDWFFVTEHTPGQPPTLVWGYAVERGSDKIYSFDIWSH